MPNDVEGDAVTMTSTVGFAIHPGQGRTLEDLLEEADEDMYRKRAQKVRVAGENPSAD